MMDQPELGGDIAAAYLLWQEGAVTSEVLVDVAVQALVDGLDSPSLRVLAGTPHAEAPYEAPELCGRAMVELGIQPSDPMGARVTLARSIARMIVSGSLDERRGAREFWWVFPREADFPDLAGEMMGLEDELDGGWGRGSDEVRGEIRSLALRALDVWGDPLSEPHRLHSAARRWLIDEFRRWSQAYGEISDSGVRASRSDGIWDYTDAAKAIFPRYVTAQLILREVERSVPSAFRGLDALRDELVEAARRAQAASHVRAEPAAEEELTDFVGWLTADHAPATELVPFRRTLEQPEVDHWRSEFERRWGVENGLWYPMLAGPTPEAVVVVDSTLWHREAAVASLQQALIDQGVSVVVSIHELEPSAEMAVALFDPIYAGPGEILATSTFPWWLLYTSHEGTTAITAGPLVDRLSETIEDWERWLA